MKKLSYEITKTESGYYVSSKEFASVLKIQIRDNRKYVQPKINGLTYYLPIGKLEVGSYTTEIKSQGSTTKSSSTTTKSMFSSLEEIDKFYDNLQVELKASYEVKQAKYEENRKNAKVNFSKHQEKADKIKKQEIAKSIDFDQYQMFLEWQKAMSEKKSQKSPKTKKATK